jgi:hypothetical protein
MVEPSPSPPSDARWQRGLLAVVGVLALALLAMALRPGRPGETVDWDGAALSLGLAAIAGANLAGPARRGAYRVLTGIGVVSAVVGLVLVVRG